MNKLLPIFLLLSTIANAQTLRLKVLDFTFGQPIEGCHVLFNGQPVGVTSTGGLVAVPDELRTATISISHVSYSKSTINLSQLPDGEVMVTLSPSSNLIEGVDVMEKKHRTRFTKMGITKDKPRDFYRHALWRPIALFIPNSEPGRKYTIQQLFIYITPRESPTSPFLVTLHSGEAEHIEPKDSLCIFGPLLTQSTGGGQYHVINLYHHKIEMPKNGLFVVLRNCPTNKKVAYKVMVMNHESVDSVNYASIGEAWCCTNKFYRWEYTDRGYNKNKGNSREALPLWIEQPKPQPRWLRDTVYWENYPWYSIAQIGNPMIYVTLKEIKE